MYYGLVYFPQKQRDQINSIRKKYDPTFGIIEPHLTLIFPIHSSIGKSNLINHINHILKNWKPFDIRFGKLIKSWDHWLFLALNSGESKVKKLSDDLYSGILSEFHRKDIKFIPHISLGLFLKNPMQYDLINPEELLFNYETYRKAYSEAESFEFNFECKVNNLELVDLNDEFSKIKPIHKFIIK